MMQSLHDLNNKLKSANRSRSKEIRLTIEEASTLVADLNELLLQQNKLLERMVELQKNSSMPSNIELSTGQF